MYLSLNLLYNLKLISNPLLVTMQCMYFNQGSILNTNFKNNYR